MKNLLHITVKIMNINNPKCWLQNNSCSLVHWLTITDYQWEHHHLSNWGKETGDSKLLPGHFSYQKSHNTSLSKPQYPLSFFFFCRHVEAAPKIHMELQWCWITKMILQEKENGRRKKRKEKVDDSHILISKVITKL